MTGGNHQIDQTYSIQMSTNKPSAPGRLVRKQKQLHRYVLPMYDGSGSNLDLVEFDVIADKSSTGSENEGFPLTQLPAERRLARRQQRQQKTTGNDCR